MRKYRALLITAICALLVAAVYFAQSINAGKMISQLSEIDDPATWASTGDETGTDIFDLGVPLGESAGERNPYIPEVIGLVNTERAKAGAGPLAETGELSAAAAKRAEELAVDFSHYRPDGSICFSVYEEFSIAGSARAENIAGNYRSPEQVLQAWMGSTGHRNNIMNVNYTRIGVGVYTDPDGKLYWVQLFAN